MIDVIQQADAIYDFDTLDFDRDGTVPVHFVSISGLNGGVSGGCLTVTTTDIGEGGEYVKVAVVQQTRAGSEHFLKGIFYHESGHTFFSFPDMNHGGSNNYNHYGIGGFDVMCGGGFNGVPSLYNPWFRNVRGWCTPTPIVSNTTGAELEDFQTTHNYYLYTPGNLPGNAMADQKFLISYHTPETDFYSTWPFADHENGGALIWHTKGNTVGKYDSYYDWRTMKLDIESAHGKFIWDEYPTYVENTEEENPLIGRDSLEIRKVVKINGYWTEIQGPYFQRDHGSASVFYTPDESGDFAFYTNPNSNWYVNSYGESYAQSVVSGFSMKNLRTDNGDIKADFYVNDFTIPSSMTLTTGKWYFYGNLTIPSGKTLTIQSGTTLEFGSGDSLIVNGTLNAEEDLIMPIGTTLLIGPGADLNFDNGVSLVVNGTLTANGTGGSPITFDKSSAQRWSGIKFQSGSQGELIHCNIKNANTGVTCTNSRPLIEYCYFDNNYYHIKGYYNSGNMQVIRNNDFFSSDNVGIYLYNCNINCYENEFDGDDEDTDGILVRYNNNSNNTLIHENDIFDGTNGIRLDYGTARIQGNDIYGNIDGISATNNASPRLLDYDETGLNVIANNYNGIYVSSTSEADLDYAWNTVAANTSKNLANYNSSVTIGARDNYWGADPPPTGKFYGNINYTPWSDEDNTGRYPLGFMKASPNDTSVASGGNIINTDDTILSGKYTQALSLEHNSSFSEASVLFNEIIDLNPDHKLAVLALNHLIRCLDRIDKGLSNSKIQQIIEKHTGKKVERWALKYSVSNLIESAKYSEAIALCKRITEKFPEAGTNSLYEEWGHQ